MRTLHYYNLPFYKHTHYTKASKLHYYYTDASITFLCTIEGLIAWKGGPTYWQIPCQALSLCVEMGFYADISWESRCKIEIDV